MKFSLSTNINSVHFDDFNYIVTSNSLRVLGTLVSSYNSGVRCFTMIGIYGTGKSSFIAALERDLLHQTKILFENKGQFNGYKKFHAINIVGDYDSLHNQLNKELQGFDSDTDELFVKLGEKLQYHKKHNEFVLIVVDEFGKVLEHAANNNPEKELYFLQKLAEFINRPEYDNVLLVTTLHQNFGAYSKKLSRSQRDEWEKVKGRFQEIVFSEPVEQLLHLAASQIEQFKTKIVSKENFDNLFELAQASGYINRTFDYDVARKIYPLDVFAGVALTHAIQRYGQNERSLFTFLGSRDSNSINTFTPSASYTYNLANVYDYVIYNFYSFLSEVNSDSTNWRAIRVAIERVEGHLNESVVSDAIKIVKTIGLLNLFGGSILFPKQSLSLYAKLALDIKSPDEVIDLLVNQKIIRYAKYKSQYILFDGTDINIEDELYKASGQVPRPVDIVDDLNSYFEFKIVQANASFYKTGTPRFFEFVLSSEANEYIPKNDIDGHINLVFSNAKAAREQLVEISSESDEATIYVLFKNTDEIISHLYEINKLEYVNKHIVVDDRIAETEINNLILYEKDLLNKAINYSLVSFSNNVEWFYKGEELVIKSQADFNKLLSFVCDDVYPLTPTMHNELFNKQRPTGAISTARVALLNTLIDEDAIQIPDLGFEEDKFPPEKTIYYSLLKNTGIHREVNGVYTLTEPNNDLVKSVWEKCESFLQSAIDTQQRLGDLIQELKKSPYKLKQGFLDFWIPMFLIVKKQDYSLYDSEGRYIPDINKEVLELLQRTPNGFRIKTFALEGIKIEFFNQYRNFINLNDRELITKDSFLETIKPFLVFYNNLNDYSKHTANLDFPYTVRFRNVLAKATDPEKTFFEDLPAAFGFENESLSSSKEFLSQYQEMIKDAIRDLRQSYSNLILKLESTIISTLGLASNDYLDYKTEITNIFKGINNNLLSGKNKSFLNRLLMVQNDKTLWYESISYVVLGKPLMKIKDNEVPVLIKNIEHLLKTLIRYVDVSKVAKKQLSSEVYNFELISTDGAVDPRSYVLPDSKKKKSDALEDKINELLTGEDDLDICTLLRVLKKKTNER